MLQDFVKLDHWRPCIRTAHKEIHAGFVRPDEGLGVSEARSPVRLVGASNSGMLDPAQNLVATLVAITVTILLVDPTLDTIAMSKALKILAEQAHPRFEIGQNRKMPD